jgi:hypothetical protein
MFDDKYFNSQLYIDNIMMLQENVWKKLSDQEKENVLQSIIDGVSNELGLSRLCTVATADLSLKKKWAQYDPKENQITINRELLSQSMNSPQNFKQIMRYPTKSLYFFLMHEVEHAIQAYYLGYPALCQNKNDLKLWRCNRHTDGPDNSYFKINYNVNNVLAIASEYLYKLQPIERDANSFAFQMSKRFVEKMHELFPDDPAFESAIDYSSSDQVVVDACIILRSKNPLQDVDNILFTMNGYFVAQPLNAYMCNIIKETQDPNLIEKIVENERENRKHLEEQIRKEMEKEQNLRVDDSLFEDPIINQNDAIER